jgi:hypothetical protein
MERLIPLLETFVKEEDVQFLFLLLKKEAQIILMWGGKSFVVLATLAIPTSTSQVYSGSCGISLVLRNCFVTTQTFK